MPRILLHPSFRRLSLYADSDLDAHARQRITAHLGRCAGCRATIHRMRSLDAEAQSLPTAPLPSDLRERVLARQRAGERVILPLADTPIGGTAPPRWWIAAVAAVLVALIGAPFFLPGSDLEANRSELVFTPAAPRPGELVHIAYRSGSLFSGEARLRLRARYLKQNDMPMPGVGRQATVAELVRGENGLFEGTVRLPDSVVYAAFAVEDRYGGHVDSNGRKLWELLVHGPDGRPLFEALAQRHFDHQSRNWELSQENVQRAAALYPDRVDAWFMLYLNERASFTGPAEDSARARARARLADFDRRLRPRAELDVESELGIMARFADEVGDTALHRYWRARLLRRAPNSLWGVQERFHDIAPLASSDPHRALSKFDSLWSEVGLGRGAVIYLPIAFYIAESTGDPEAIRLWADRLARFDPSSELGPMLTRHPALREEGMARLRARLRTLERVDDAVRPLEHSVPEERLARREQAGRVFADLGAALLESGQLRAALDTLERSIQTGWDAALFRRVAALRLQVGDTTGAAAPLALAAANPLGGATLGDSAHVLLGSYFNESTWRNSLANARREMRERVLTHATRKSLPESIRLRAPDGRTVELREIAAGRPTFVAFWNRYCPMSAEQIPQLQRVAATLQAQGYAVVTVTEHPTPEFRRYLSEHGLTLPIYTDPQKELGQALDQWGTPEYFVLDPEGIVRFGPLLYLEAVPAQMAVVAAADEAGNP